MRVLWHGAHCSMRAPISADAVRMSGAASMPQRLGSAGWRLSFAGPLSWSWRVPALAAAYAAPQARLLLLARRAAGRTYRCPKPGQHHQVLVADQFHQLACEPVPADEALVILDAEAVQAQVRRLAVLLASLLSGFLGCLVPAPLHSASPIGRWWSGRITGTLLPPPLRSLTARQKDGAPPTCGGSRNCLTW